ncbi:MAG TPA: hypothetical protein VHF27_07270 [Acidimicrobiales bacterium]|nr:hypothetical protein [Acidimicrobiales bacterium]
MSPRRAVAALALVSLLAAGMAACSRSSPPAAGRLTVDGQAEVTSPGEGRREVTGSHDLDVGDRVRVRQGTAVIRLPGERRLELRQGSDVELQETEQEDTVRPAVMAGDLLVVSDEEPFPVAATGAEVVVRGDARISRGVALLVATYEGTAELSSAGSAIAVPALRQTALPPTGQFPTRVSPLEFSADDGWDQRYLSDAIELTGQLDGRSQAFTAQLGPNEGRSFAYFRDLYPRLAAEPGFTASLVNPARPPGETLVGAAITAQGGRGTFAERWAAVFGFRDEGARWGLVALDQGVNRVPLLEAVDAATSRGPTLFAEGPGTGTPSSVAPPSRGGAPATTSVPRGATTTGPARPRPGSQATTTSTTPPAAGPTTTVPTGPLNTGTPLVDETVNSLVDTLTGLLRSLGGG